MHPNARRRGIGATMIRTALSEGGPEHPDLGARQCRGRPCHGVRTRSGGRSRAASDEAAARPACRPSPAADGVRITTYSGPAGRRRIAAGQQRRVLVASRAGRLDRGRHRRAPRRSRGSTRPGLFLAYDQNTDATARIPLDESAFQRRWARCTWSASTRRRRAADWARRSRSIGMHHLAERLSASGRSRR